MKAIKSWVTIKVNMANKCTEFVSIFSFRHFILKTSYDWFLLRLFSVFHFTKLNQCHAHRKYIKNMTSRNFLWLNSLLEIQLFKCTCTRDFFRYFNFDAKKSCVTQRRIVWCCSVLILETARDETSSRDVSRNGLNSVVSRNGHFSDILVVSKKSHLCNFLPVCCLDCIFRSSRICYLTDSYGSSVR